MQWPVQIKLLPVQAPFYENSNLLIAADYTAYAYAAFHRDFIKNHITLVGCPKLDEGDYQIEGQPKITVDRKKDMQEMYNCVVNDKSRFYKEVRRCHQKGIKLYVLIEHGGQIKSLADVPKWKPKYGTISSREISERLYRLHISYGVEVLFCDKRCTARRVIEILTQNQTHQKEM